jgi:hypothetical protein
LSLYFFQYFINRAGKNQNAAGESKENPAGENEKRTCPKLQARGQNVEQTRAAIRTGEGLLFDQYHLSG